MVTDSTAATEPCGATASLSGAFGEEGVEFTCDLPADHEGWHRDLSEEDEYRWAR